MSNVNLGVFSRGGSTGQVFVADAASADGGAWKNNAVILALQKQADFGSGPPGTEAVTLTFADGNVSANSIITVSAQIDPSRALDELELDPVDVFVGLIQPGQSVTVVVVAGNNASKPHGLYQVNYHRA